MKVDNMKNKKIILIVFIAILVFASTLGILFFVLRSLFRTPLKKNISSIDKDTGNTINSPNTESEKSINKSGIVIYGLDSLSQNDSLKLKADQLLALRTDLTTRALNSLPDHGNVFKVFNVNYKNNKLEAEFIYKDQVEPARIYISIDSSGNISYSINRDNNEIYNSGVLKK